MAAARRLLQTLVANSRSSSCSGYGYGVVASRSISSSPRLDSVGWFDKIKTAVTGKAADPKPQSFSLIDFAEQMDKARKLGSFKNFVVGRCSETTISHAFEKHSAILRYLGSIDANGENLTNSHKSDAAKHCNCTISEVEHILAKYAWAKEAQKKIEKLKEEGKPLPKSFSEVQKLVGSSPLEVGRSNLAKSGQISRNALCPCKSGKRYKSYWPGGPSNHYHYAWDSELNNTPNGTDHKGDAVLMKRPARTLRYIDVQSGRQGIVTSSIGDGTLVFRNVQLGR